VERKSNLLDYIYKKVGMLNDPLESLVLILRKVVGDSSLT
jgi:hypothetical protein